MSIIAHPCAPVKSGPYVPRFDAWHYRWVATYGSGPTAAGMVLDCDCPDIASDCLALLHGDNHDQAPGDDHALEVVSVPALDFERERDEWDWDREYALEAREVERHNREAMGYGSW